MTGRTKILYLSAHGFDLAVQPGRGGRVIALRRSGADVFHPVPRPEIESMLDGGCFPLVPFSNRIRDGRFAFNGRDYALPINWDQEAHAIHGEGWTCPWSVTHQDGQSIRMKMKSADWWPWTYECVQDISLADNQVDLTLRLTNTDKTPMPAGLGFHPYFPRHPDTSLEFSAASVIPPLSDQPTTAMQLTPETDFSASHKLGMRNLDHCYSGWAGPARIHQPKQSLNVQILPTPHSGSCVVYLPPGAPYFCFEPVSHLNGAFENTASTQAGLRHLDAGETFDFRMTLTFD